MHCAIKLCTGVDSVYISDYYYHHCYIDNIAIGTLYGPR